MCAHGLALRKAVMVACRPLALPHLLLNTDITHSLPDVKLWIRSGILFLSTHIVGVMM
jgi:hypothetical protein